MSVRHLCLAVLLLVPLLATPVHGVRPPTSLVIGPDEMGGPSPAYAVRVQAQQAKSLWATGCVRTADPAFPVGIAFQVFEVKTPGDAAGGPLATGADAEPRLTPFYTYFETFGPKDRHTSAWAMVSASPGTAIWFPPKRDYTVMGLCFVTSVPLPASSRFDAVVVAAAENTDPAVVSFEVRFVDAVALDVSWSSRAPDAASFLVPHEMAGPVVEAGSGSWNGATTVGGVTLAQSAKGTYGGIGRNLEPGAYAVVGPSGVHPACSILTRNHCPAGVLPAEQFAGPPGDYALVNLASSSMFGHGLEAFWIDLPLPPGVKAGV